MFADDTVPGGVESEICTLAGLFRKPWIYRVPRFQRAYSWTLLEVGQLIEDLRASAARDHAYYFLGPLLAVRAEENVVEIVDGQQRLSTLILTLAYLAVRMQDRTHAASLLSLISAPSGRDAERRVRLRLRPVDDEFFREGVWAPAQLATLADRKVRGVTLTDTQILIASAAKTIVKALADLTPEELDHLARFICRRAIFNLVLVDDRDAASMLFRISNDRGKDLSLSAIIKSELLERSGLPEDEAEEAAQRWDELEDELGVERFQELLDLIPLIVTGRAIQRKGGLSVFRDEVLGQVPPAQFLRERGPRYAEVLRQVLDAQVDAGAGSDEVNRRIRCMQNLRDKFWLAPAVGFLADFNGDPKVAARFFTGLERLTFACFLGVVDSRVREDRFARIIRARMDVRALFGPAAGEQRLAGERGALELTPAETRNLIARLNEPFRANHNQRRIVALRINAALPKGEALPLHADATVEHVLPKRAGRDWFDAFPDEMQREELANLIGNWALVSKAQNDKAAALRFAEKQRVFFKTPGAPLRAMTADIEKMRRWDPATIRQRQEMMVPALCRDLSLY